MYKPDEVKLDDIPGGLIVYRSDSEEILYANAKALRMFECDTMDDFMLHSGGVFSSLVLKDDLYLAEQSLRYNEILEDLCSGHVYYRCKTRSGRIIYVEEYGKVVEDPQLGRLNYIFIVLHNKNGQGMIDPLTGLLNTYLLLELAESKRLQCLNEHRDVSLTVIYFNIVKFSLYNDTFGTATGNEFLRMMGILLRNVFQTDSVSRLAGDRFVVLYTGNDEKEKIKEIHEKAAKLDPSYSMRVTAGIFYSNAQQNVIEACDFAKAACEDIVDGDEVYYKVETAESRFALDLKKYVQSSLENALNKGYIRVYYQPVVRTLTGAMCSVEALSRWDDPKHGFIPPAVYIQALEESGLSIRLDTYVMQEVGKMLHERIKAGQQIFPVSVNFSRKDFIFGNPYEVVESVVSLYELPRELICIEITESAVMEDPQLIRHQMEEFKCSGYELWMDDFGSAYSSLNILKDFPFDEIKIDLGFLKNLNDNARKIVTSVVDMAKKLGMHTLAEGVENSYQLDFLRSIGCEKIQGYYYGKPMLMEELSEMISSSSLHVESSAEREFYDASGTVNFVTDLPLAMFMFDGVVLKPLFFNKEYRNTLLSAGFVSESAFAEVINSKIYPVSRKLRKLVADALNSGKEESMDIVLNARYYRFNARIVSKSLFGEMIQGSIVDITYDKAHKRVSELDEVLRNIVSAYDCIYLIDGDENSFEVIETDRPNEKAGDKVYNFFESSELASCFQIIYFADREKFRRYSSLSFIQETIKRIGRGYFTEVFRVKQRDGNYEWKAFTVIALPETNRHRYLLCVKPSSLANMENPVELARSIMGDEGTQIPLNSLSCHGENLKWDQGDNLWNAFANLGNIKFFWKDNQRRFVGVSRSFLDYYGFRSFDEIAGKTDEEIGWHLDNTQYRDDELAVLQHGRVVVNSHGQNIIHGTIRNIVATKFPVYKNGKICGLSGYFVDIDELSMSKELASATFVDKTTGFMNSRGFMVATAQFEDNLRLHTEDFILCVIHISSYHNIYSLYGKDVAEALILRISEIIRGHFGIGSAFARIQHNRFVIFSKFSDSTRELNCAIEKCVEEIRKLREINGRRCSLKVSHGEALGSESHSLIQLFELVMSRMAQMENTNWNLTSSEIHDRVISLKKIFDMVRVVDVSRRRVITFGENGTKIENPGYCCRTWGRERRCTNCISSKVLHTRSMSSKFEIIDNSIFYVIARYLEVDGRPYVLEVINRLIEPPFPRSEERDQLASRLIHFNSDVYTDKLTTILNRRYFDEQLANLTVNAVAVLDIDDFKRVNEIYGHARGDELLKTIARTIVDTVHDEGLVVRYGGDEFVICLEETGREQLQELLRKVYDSVASLKVDEDCRIKINIGACYGCEKADELLSKADRCLYESKLNGGIKILVNPVNVSQNHNSDPA